MLVIWLSQFLRLQISVDWPVCVSWLTLCIVITLNLPLKGFYPVY